MTNMDIVNGLIFKALDIEKDTFDSRLLSQKKIFLLQELGVDLGYSYNWYIRGPYSPDLANYIFNNIDLLKEQDFKGYQITDEVKKKIDFINNLVDKKPKTLTIPSWYELLASVLYIHNKWKKNSKDAVIESLKEYKPQYTEENADEAIKELEKLGCYA